MSRLKNNGSRALISTELFISGKTWEPLERMPTWWLDIRRKARLEVGQRLVAWRPEGSIAHDYRAYILELMVIVLFGQSLLVITRMMSRP